MEIGDACRLVGDDKGAGAHGILCRNAGRTHIGMTGLRLDTAKRKHETACGIAPIGTQRHCARNIESCRNLAACPNANAIARAYACLLYPSDAADE